MPVEPATSPTPGAQLPTVDPGTATTPNTATEAASTPPRPAGVSTPAQRAAKLKAAKSSTDRVRAYRERKRAQTETVAPSPGQPATPPEPPDPRTDAEVSRDVGIAIRGLLWPVLGLLARLFGYRLEALERSDEEELGRAFLPIARRYVFLASVSRWIAAPAVLARKISEKLKRREKKPEASAAKEAQGTVTHAPVVQAPPPPNVTPISRGGAAALVGK